VDASGEIHNLFIHQAKGGKAATTYTAEQGRMDQADGIARCW
jgi:lipopolysaccharide export system permease protein